MSTTIDDFKYIATRLPPGQAILLRGPTGIGKSAIVRQLADDLGMPMIDVRTATMQEGDFNGIPNLERIRETGIATNAMYGWFVRACNEACVVFLDEFVRGIMPVLQGSLQLTLDRSLSNDERGMPYTLHPETRLIAAGNFGEEYEGEDLDPAMLRRFLVIDLEPTVDEWLGWAKAHVDPIILEFIKENPTLLRGDPTLVPGAVCPNPATWHGLSNNYRHAGMAPSDWCGQTRPRGAFTIAQGMIGLGPAGKLLDFIERYQLLLSAEIVIDTLGKDPTVSDRIKALDAPDAIDLAERVVHHIAERPQLNDKQLANLGEFLKLLSAEVFMKVNAMFGKLQSDNEKLKKLYAQKIRTLMTPLIIEHAGKAAKLAQQNDRQFS